MLVHIQMDKDVLGKWQKSGYLFMRVFTRTREGTPQGGIISPTLANATLNGIEGLLVKYRNSRRMENPSRRSKKAKKRFTDNTHEVIFGNKTAREQQIIDELNPKLTGWGNYFQGGCIQGGVRKDGSSSPMATEKMVQQTTPQQISVMDKG